jgi:acyl-CoA thioesterase
MILSQLFQDIEHQEWVDIPKGWLQGRTIYGGLTTAMMMHKAIITVNDPAKRLLSTSVTFVGPVEEKPVKISVEILRQGKSVTSVEARLWQDDEVRSILLASFGLERESNLKIQQQRPAPHYPEAESLFILQHNKKMPQCYQNFQLAWAEGGFPCSSSEQPDFGGWFRFDPSQYDNLPMQTAEFLMLLDIWPAGAFSVMTTPAPGSSLSWYITLLESTHYERLDWFKYKVFTDHAENGYATEYAHIWDKKDRLIAISRQTVTIFA